MSPTSAQVTVTTTAAAITAASSFRDWQGGSSLLRNASDASIFVGGSNVTTSNGFEIPTGQAVWFPGLSGLYAITASGSKRLDVLSFSKAG